MPADPICFVISPIGEPDTLIRKRSDQVLKYIIKPAAEECGFKTLRADEIPQPGIITSQVIQHIIEADMVVADLTGRNPNVFYELAIRHAIRRPYVQLIDQNEPLPFDVAGLGTIQFNYQDLESADFAKNEIIKQMRSMIGTDAQVVSPITIAVDLSTLKKSDNPQDRHFGELLTAMSEIKQQLSLLQRPVSIPASLAASSPYQVKVSDGMYEVHSLPNLGLTSGGVHLDANTVTVKNDSLFGVRPDGNTVVVQNPDSHFGVRLDDNPVIVHSSDPTLTIKCTKAPKKD
jgi:hypothetical protein